MTKAPSESKIIRKPPKNPKILYDQKRFFYYKYDISLFFYNNLLYLIYNPSNKENINKEIYLFMQIVGESYNTQKEPEIVHINVDLINYNFGYDYTNFTFHLKHGQVDTFCYNNNYLTSLSEALPLLAKIQHKPNIINFFWSVDENVYPYGTFLMKTNLLQKLIDDLDPNQSVKLTIKDDVTYFISEKDIKQMTWSLAFTDEVSTRRLRGTYFKVTPHLISSLASAKNRLAQKIYQNLTQKFIEYF